MIANPGAEILYRASTGLERALADVDAERLMALGAELIIENQDPLLVQARNIEHLAFGLGVNLWEDNWSLATKREWLLNQWTFQHYRGTITAQRMALAANGYDLLEYVAPPQGFFASPDLSPSEYNSWIRRMPEIRIYQAPEPGTAHGDEFYVGDGFADEHAAGLDDGWALYGRKAILRRDGVDTPLVRYEFRTEYVERPTVDDERVSIPGDGSVAFFADEDHVGDDRFVDGDAIDPKLYTARLHRTVQDAQTDMYLTALDTGLTPIDTNYERNSDIGDASLEFFAGDGFAGEEFAGYDDAPLMLADRIYLLDPSIAAPMTEGISFAGVDRVGMPPFTIELMVDLHTVEKPGDWFARDTFVGEGFASPMDTTEMDRALRAVVAAKGFNDRALVSFETVRPLRFYDEVTENARVNDHVRNVL